MTEDPKKPPEVQRFEFSGIEQRRGMVPKWLVAVYAALFIWMIWYLVQFWTERG